MKRYLIYICLLFLPILSWGQTDPATQGFNFTCTPETNCDDGLDSDGDGVADCDDLDCYIAELLSNGRSKMVCDAVEEQFFDEFVLANQDYFKDKGIESVSEAQAEMVGAIDCIASAMVSVIIEYTIHWFTLNLSGTKNYGFFDTNTATTILSQNKASIIGNAVIACGETFIPFKISRLDRFLINAGTGFGGGIIGGIEQEYNQNVSDDCEIKDIVLDKINWGAVMLKGSEEAIVSLIVNEVGTIVGPRIREAFNNDVDVENKIKDNFGDYGNAVWEAIRRKFIKSADDLFAAFPNIKQLSDDVKFELNDLGFSDDVLAQFDNALGSAAARASFEDAVNTLPVGSWKNLVDNPSLVEDWRVLRGLKACPARSNAFCKYTELLKSVFGGGLDPGLIGKFKQDAVGNANLYEAMANSPQLLKGWNGLADRDFWIRTNVALLEKLRGNESLIPNVNDFYRTFNPGGPYPTTRNGIYFDEFGFPDFSDFYAPISRNRYFNKALQGNHSGSNDFADAADWFVANNPGAVLDNSKKGIVVGGMRYVMHHMEDGQTIVPVLDSQHSGTSHTGGGSIIRNGLQGFFSIN